MLSWVFTYQQNQDPTSTANLTQEGLMDNYVNASLKPDLNPVQHLWTDW